MGGISLILFGLISYNGFKVLRTKVNWNWQAIVVVIVTLYVGLSRVLVTFIGWLPVIEIKMGDFVLEKMFEFAPLGFPIAIVGIIVSYALTFTEDKQAE